MKHPAQPFHNFYKYSIGKHLKAFKYFIFDEEYIVFGIPKAIFPMGFAISLISKMILLIGFFVFLISKIGFLISFLNSEIRKVFSVNPIFNLATSNTFLILTILCKPVSGLLTKKCKLISGRVENRFYRSNVTLPFNKLISSFKPV